ncbi:MAG: aspartate--tRNA ligase, partial [Bacilli bacterium]|nr:aspartate--tRNA ligase [Bacilli bacterium]
ESKNLNLPTGEVEVQVDKAIILSEAENPPMIISDITDALEDFRMKYRYLDLRRPILQKNLILRHNICKAVRSYFDEREFVEIETPVFGKSTPEGARDYLVPSRIHPGKFYALPQSPQLYKQLLMIAGFGRYYQIVKCFRDEDSRSDRQMEFTQIDVEMSFIDEENIYSLIEGMIVKIMKDVMGVTIATPFNRISFEESMDRYGTDKPDTRFGLELCNLNKVFENIDFSLFQDVLKNKGVIKGINVRTGAGKYSRKEIERLTNEAKKFRAKGLAWLKYENETFSGSISKYLNLEIEKALIKELSLENGDLVLIIADETKIANVALGALRNLLGKELNLIDKDRYDYLWVNNWPSFEYDEEKKRYIAAHHPFTAPKDDCLDLLLTDPSKCYSKCYDIVLNGFELGSGSIRIHNQEVQKKMFKTIGLTDKEIKEKFGFFVEALKYGTPPHGGIALGLDRLTMILCKANSLRDVIAFPKSAGAIDPMSEAPSYVSLEQLDELKLEIKK